MRLKLTFFMIVTSFSAGLATETLRQDERERTIEEWRLEYLAIEKQIKMPLPAHVAGQSHRRESLVLSGDRDPLDVIVRRTRSLAEHLVRRNPDLDLSNEFEASRKLEEDARAVSVAEPERRTDLFREACKLLRTIALKNPLLDFNSILFTKRHSCPAPKSGPHENTGNHMIDQFFGFNALPGGGLYVLENAFSEKPSVRNVLKGAAIENGRYAGRKIDSNWGILAPELSFDGREILFCATETTGHPRHSFQWNKDNVFHIFKTNIRGDTLVQLTDGPWNDIDPCFLPSGRIAFISERRGGYGRCHPRPAPSYTLHSMNRDGSDVVMLSPHETNEWQPSVSHSGMIVYTRWDYVDRGAHQAHHPWETTPDGRDARAIQGNYPHHEKNRPHMEMDIRAVPGSSRFIATAAAHHGQAFGSLVLINPNALDDGAMSPLKRITPDELFPESEQSIYQASSTVGYGTPFPLDEDFYLCVYDPFSSTLGGPANNYGIYLLDGFGNRVLLYRDPEISCLSPIPVRETPMPPVVPHQTLTGVPLGPDEMFEPSDPETLPKTARILLMNVYNSRLPFPEGVRVKELRVVKIVPKTTPISDQPRIGYGMQKNIRMVLGTVPVEDDGSAFFTAPVDVPIYFQALDHRGNAVQSMRTVTYVKPGETLACNGCHEDRLQSAVNFGKMPRAIRKAPSEIRPEPSGSIPYSYPLLVQPVLDKHCATCHEKESRAGNTFRLGPGDISKRHFYESYDHLKPYVFFYDDYAWTEPETLPGRFGALASPLTRILDEGHYDVNLSPEDRRRLTIWMDMNGDFYGSSDDIERQKNGEIVWPRMK